MLQDEIDTLTNTQTQTQEKRKENYMGSYYPVINQLRN